MGHSLSILSMQMVLNRSTQRLTSILRHDVEAAFEQFREQLSFSVFSCQVNHVDSLRRYSSVLMRTNSDVHYASSCTMFANVRLIVFVHGRPAGPSSGQLWNCQNPNRAAVQWHQGSVGELLADSGCFSANWGNRYVTHMIFS